MHAVILERNKLVGRRVARQFLATGFTVETIDDPSALPTTQRADVVCADVFDGDLVAERIRATAAKGVLWTAEPLRRALKLVQDTPGISHVLGRRDFETPPRPWEVVMVARRLIDPAQQAPLSAFVEWGASALEVEVSTPADRDRTVAQIGELITSLQAPRRIAEMFGELAHELIMNAMYGAPVDANGRPKYAADRKADIRLLDHERPVVRLASDGSRIVLQVRDPFGRLSREHVVGGLVRGLAGGEQDRSHGGAGLGLTISHNASSALLFDVARGRFSEVTAMFELDMNLRDFRAQAKSLHLWSR